MTQKRLLVAGAERRLFQVGGLAPSSRFCQSGISYRDEAHLLNHAAVSKPISKASKPDTDVPADKFYRDQNIELIADRAAFIDRAGTNGWCSLPAPSLIMAT